MDKCRCEYCELEGQSGCPKHEAKEEIRNLENTIADYEDKNEAITQLAKAEKRIKKLLEELYIYYDYSDQITFIEEDIKKLDELTQEKNV